MSDVSCQMSDVRSKLSGVLSPLLDVDIQGQMQDVICQMSDVRCPFHFYTVFQQTGRPWQIFFPLCVQLNGLSSPSWANTMGV